MLLCRYAYEYYYINYVHVYLTGNPINSPLPTEWSEWLGLDTLFIDSCNITGTIPDSWPKLTADGHLRNLALFDNPELKGCLPSGTAGFTPWNINWWGPVTTQEDYPYLKNYQRYLYKDLNSVPLPQEWPPLSGTGITGPCESAGQPNAAAVGASEPPRPEEP